MIDLLNKKIILSGSSGFLGSFVKKELISAGATVIDISSSDDLTNEETINSFKNIQPDYFIHLAGYNGGISFNQSFPFDIFEKNSKMAFNALKIAINCKVKKFIGVLTSCGYPPDNGNDIYENTYLDHKPHESISSHGYAKRNLLIACQLANKQYGLNAVCLVPNTIYGPGDNLDPNRTKVMMALIKKFVDAKNNNLDEVVCWGTGNPVREFIFVEDAAKLIVQSINTFDDNENPLNLSTGQFYSIKSLAEKISHKLDFKGKIIWDDNKPDGQFKKILNIDKMKSLFPNFQPTPIDSGIEKTINWYKKKLQYQKNSF